MIKYITIIIIAFINSLSIITGQIVAKFSEKVESGTMNVEIKNQSSKDAKLYIIDYGDGTVQKDTVQIDYYHHYSSPGTYNICLTASMVTIAEAKVVEPVSDTYCSSVTIPDTSCYADFSYSIDGLSLTLINKSIGNYTKTYWLINDTKGIVNKDVVNHKFLKPGTYNVKLRVENKKTGCVSQHYENIFVQGDTTNCVAYFMDSVINNRTIQFTNLSLGLYNKLIWHFGDGSKSKENNPTHEFKSSGLYEVSLLLENNNNKVYSIYTKNIPIDTQSVDYFPLFENLLLPDSLGIILFNNSKSKGACKYIWSFGDNSTLEDSVAQHTYNKPGDYNVCLTQYTPQGKSSTKCKLINVGQVTRMRPDFSTYIDENNVVYFLPIFDTFPTEVCWDFGDGLLSNEFEPIHTYERPDIYLVKLKVKYNNNETYAIKIVNLTENESKLICRFIAEQENTKKKGSKNTKTIRYRGSLSGDVSRLKFQWQYGDGSCDSLNFENSHEYTENGSYDVCFSVSNELTGDSDSYCQTILVNENKTLEIENPKTLLNIINNNKQIKIVVESISTEKATIEIFDINGRLIKNVFKGMIQNGKNTFSTDLPYGVYIVKYKSNTNLLTAKTIVF